MYPAQVKKLDKVLADLEAVIEWLQDKVDNAGESDTAQDRASSIEDVIGELESARDSLTDGKDNLEGVE